MRINSKTDPTSGLTLLEVVIAMSILLVVLALAANATISTLSVDALGQARDDLTLEGSQCLQEIGADLSLSGWWWNAASSYNTSSFTADRGMVYYPYVLQQGGAGFPTAGEFQIFSRPVALTGLPGAAYARMVEGNLSTARAVGLPGIPVGMPGFTADWDKTPAGDFTAGPGAAQTYLGSFFARSQELVFLRSSVGAIDPKTQRPVAAQQMSSRNRTLPVLDFSGPTSLWNSPNAHALITAQSPTNTPMLRPSGWILDASNNYVSLGAQYGVVLDAAIYNTGIDADSRPLLVQWETVGGSDFTVANQQAANLRRYSYAVVPSPNPNRFGRLIRAATISGMGIGLTDGTNVGQRLNTAGGQTLVVDRVLSDNVTRIVFNTMRHSPNNNGANLGVNCVQVVIYMAKFSESRPRVLVSERMSTVIAMRTLNSTGDKNSADAALRPSTPILFSY